MNILVLLAISAVSIASCYAQTIKDVPTNETLGGEIKKQVELDKNTKKFAKSTVIKRNLPNLLKGSAILFDGKF